MLGYLVGREERIFASPRLGGTPGSPLGPLPPFGTSKFLPFCVTGSLDEKWQELSWVPGGYCFAKVIKILNYLLQQR